MDELTLDGNTYLSSKRAAQVTGYAKDYVGQLCREGRVAARLVGRNWYVLESSILEHRFGAEEVQKNEEMPHNQPERTWESPMYSAESPQMVPELRPKPIEIAQEVIATNKTVLADMQSAWQEWFDTQASEEKMLPEPSNMLLEDPEDVASKEQSLIESLPTPEEEPGEVSVPIHIERETEPAYVAPVPVVEEPAVPVMTHRSQVRPMVAETPYKAPRRVRRSSGSAATANGALKALFIGVAGIAIAVTVIGSGAADRYLGATFNSPLSFITRMIGGVQNISK